MVCHQFQHAAGKTVHVDCSCFYGAGLYSWMNIKSTCVYTRTITHALDIFSTLKLDSDLKKTTFRNPCAMAYNNNVTNSLTIFRSGRILQYLGVAALRETLR